MLTIDGQFSALILLTAVKDWGRKLYALQGCHGWCSPGLFSAAHRQGSVLTNVSTYEYRHRQGLSWLPAWNCSKVAAHFTLMQFCTPRIAKRSAIFQLFRAPWQDTKIEHKVCDLLKIANTPKWYLLTEFQKHWWRKCCLWTTGCT